MVESSWYPLSFHGNYPQLLPMRACIHRTQQTVIHYMYMQSSQCGAVPALLEIVTTAHHESLAVGESCEYMPFLSQSVASRLWKWFSMGQFAPYHTYFMGRNVNRINFKLAMQPIFLSFFGFSAIMSSLVGGIHYSTIDKLYVPFISSSVHLQMEVGQWSVIPYKIKLT